MDVTSQALRDIEIKEVRRGYDCDAVDDLLEQAAATIDALERRIALAEQHARDSEAQGSNARASEDMLQRTLLLAQRAAEDAVAEATATATAITSAADSQARATILEATSTAQREANAQRLALETEVLNPALCQIEAALPNASRVAGSSCGVQMAATKRSGRSKTIALF